jgi:hypothetical protein
MDKLKTIVALATGVASALILEHKLTTRAKILLVGGNLAALGATTSLALNTPLGLVFSGGVVIGTALRASRRASQATLEARPARRAAVHRDDGTAVETAPVALQQTEAAVTLRELLAHPPVAPRGLKVVLDVYKLDTAPTKTRYYWSGAQVDNTAGDWVPASAVKIFAAVGALQKLERLGFGAGTDVTFTDSGQTASIGDLVRRSIVESDNMAYNRLVQLAGHDELHETLLDSFGDTELNTPYIKDEWRALTGGNSTFAAPRIQLSEGGRTQSLDATPSRAPRLCGGRSACTSPGSLNDMIFEAVLSTRLGLSEGLSNILAGALGARKRSGADFSDAIFTHMGAPEAQVFGKHGFNGTAYTQTALIYDPASQYAFVVTATCEGGSRASLNDVGRALGEIIRAKRLNT